MTTSTWLRRAGPLVPRGRARQAVSSVDGTSLVTAWLLLLFAIPATQVLGPLGAVGTPAMLVAMVAATGWASTRVVPDLPADHGPQPLRVAVYVYVWYGLATVAFARTRVLTDLEVTGSLREAIMLLSLTGVALLVMDGISSLERLRTVLRRLVWFGSLLATLGIAEFFTRTSLAPTIPGLSVNTADDGLESRSLFSRVQGTTTHPIEFSVVMAALLPLALYFAMEGEPGSKQRRRAIAAAAAIAFSIPLGVSRSGVVSVVAGLAIVSVAWSWRRRIEAAVVGFFGVVGMWMLVPGMVGTIRSLFTSVDVDPSVQARIDRVPQIMALIREAPWFGRGLGTFSVEDYLLVDNQVYVTTIEVGVVGLLLTFGLLVLAVAAAITSRHHRLATDDSAHLGYAVAGGIAALGISLFTFDALHYHILHGCLMLLVGVAGALWRLTRTNALRPSPLVSASESSRE